MILSLSLSLSLSDKLVNKPFVTDLTEIIENPPFSMLRCPSFDRFMKSFAQQSSCKICGFYMKGPDRSQRCSDKFMYMCTLHESCDTWSQ